MWRLILCVLILMCVTCDAINKGDESPFTGEITVEDGIISDVSGDVPLREGDPAPFLETIVTDTRRFELYKGECTGTGRMIQCEGGVEIYDVATGDLLGTYATPQTPMSIVVRDDLAYITWRSGDVLGGGGLVIVDISAPENVVEVGAHATLRHAYELAFADENTLYVLTMDQMDMLDVSDPAAPELIGTYRNKSALMDMLIDGERIYLIEGKPCAPSTPLECDHRLLELNLAAPDDAPLRTIDLPEPEAPYLRAEQRMMLIDGLLYVPVGDSRFVVLRK